MGKPTKRRKPTKPKRITRSAYINVRITEQLSKKLTRAANKARCSISDVVNQWLEDAAP